MNFPDFEYGNSFVFWGKKNAVRVKEYHWFISYVGCGLK